MKSTLLWLLVFNALMGAVIVVVANFTDTGRPGESILPQLILVGWWFAGNVYILFTNRKKMANSITDGAVEVAAVTIELKDAARQRVKDRVNKRLSERAEERNK